MAGVHLRSSVSRYLYGRSLPRFPGCSHRLTERSVVNFVDIANGLFPFRCLETSLFQVPQVPCSHTAFRRLFWNAISLQVYGTTSLSTLGEVDFGLIVGECLSNSSPLGFPPLFLFVAFILCLLTFLTSNLNNHLCPGSSRTENCLLFPGLSLTRKVGKLFHLLFLVVCCRQTTLSIFYAL